MKNKSAILYCLVFLTLGVGGFQLQKYLLDQMQQSQLLIVQHGEETYYGEDISYIESNNINTEKINYLDKIKLLKNQKQRTQKEIEEKGAEVLTLRQASVLAKKKFTLLHDLGLAPVSIESSLDNWYTYRGTLYEYKDKIFGNFKCRIWTIEYIAYDNSVHIELTMDAVSGVIYQCNITSAKGMLDMDVFDESLLAGKEEVLAKGLSILLTETGDKIDKENQPDLLYDLMAKNFYIKDDVSEETVSSYQKKYLCIDDTMKEEFYVTISNNRDNFIISFVIP